MAFFITWSSYLEQSRKTILKMWAWLEWGLGRGWDFPGFGFQSRVSCPLRAKTYHAILTPPCQPRGSEPDPRRLYKVSTSTAFSTIVWKWKLSLWIPSWRSCSGEGVGLRFVVLSWCLGSNLGLSHGIKFKSWSSPASLAGCLNIALMWIYIQIAALWSILLINFSRQTGEMNSNWSKRCQIQMLRLLQKLILMPFILYWKRINMTVLAVWKECLEGACCRPEKSQRWVHT